MTHCMRPASTEVTEEEEADCCVRDGGVAVRDVFGGAADAAVAVATDDEVDSGG